MLPVVAKYSVDAFGRLAFSLPSTGRGRKQPTWPNALSRKLFNTQATVIMWIALLDLKC